MKSSLLILLTLILISCKEQEARRPIQATPSITVYESVKEENRILNEQQNNEIALYIQQDTVHQYINSSYGFWYTYSNKISEEQATPQEGDFVEFDYEIKDLSNGTIYSKEDLGKKTLKLGREDFIPALLDGLKLMKIGETLTFAIPSYRAFGISGDKNRININQSIIVTVTLTNIIKNESN